MKRKLFDLTDFLQHNEHYHIARVSFSVKHDISLHHHNFYEFVLIEKGSGHQLINGHKIKIRPGDIYMIRPDDTHMFIPNPNEQITIVNIAFSAETADHLKSRYFTGSEIYFWSRSQLPYHVHLPLPIHKRISSRTDEAIGSQRSLLQLDGLLIFIFRIMESVQPHCAVESLRDEDHAPHWLRQAINQYNSPKQFMGGVDLFVELCDRNVSYINRTIRKHYGMTMTEIMNNKRLEYAHTQLILTSMPTKEICRNCGFSNISYFYKLFKLKYGITPKRYRTINQGVV